jgi:hypothetical protein
MLRLRTADMYMTAAHYETAWKPIFPLNRNFSLDIVFSGCREVVIHFLISRFACNRPTHTEKKL